MYKVINVYGFRPGRKAKLEEACYWSREKLSKAFRNSPRHKMRAVRVHAQSRKWDPKNDMISRASIDAVFFLVGKLASLARIPAIKIVKEGLT